jgi:hypothetical protein
MQWHRGPYTIDTDRDRLDMATVIVWLRGTYWAAYTGPQELHNESARIR